MNAKIKKLKVIYQVRITPQKMFNVSVSEEFNPIIINRITMVTARITARITRITAGITGITAIFKIRNYTVIP